MELDEEDIEGDFDQIMKETLSNYEYDDNIAVEDEEKPTFSEIDDEDYDEEDDVEDWDNWTGGDGGANSKGRKKGRRKSKFAEAIEQSSAKPVFDPED